MSEIYDILITIHEGSRVHTGYRKVFADVSIFGWMSGWVGEVGIWWVRWVGGWVGGWEGGWMGRWVPGRWVNW